MQAGRYRGNQGGRQEDNHGRRQWNGNEGSHGGMPGGDDRGEHDDGQNGQLGDSEQRRNGGRRQGGTQSGVHSGIQHSNQSSSDGRQHGGGHTSGPGQGSGGVHSGRNSGEQNAPAGGRGRQNQDQRRYLKGHYHEHSLKKSKRNIHIFMDANLNIIVELRIFIKSTQAIKDVLQCITSTCARL